MMGKRTTTLLSLFLLLGPSSSLAQQDETATRATPYRIAIFPAGGFGGNEANVAREKAVSLVQANIQKDPALVLAYSYYDHAMNKPRIKNPDRLWVQKRPNLEVVYTLARERAVDGVVMLRGTAPGSPWAPRDQSPIDLYLIDIDHRQVYRAKATTKESSGKLTKRVFVNFMKGRPK